jgi:hypothetical protein
MPLFFIYELCIRHPERCEGPASQPSRTTRYVVPLEVINLAPGFILGSLIKNTVRG